MTKEQKDKIFKVLAEDRDGYARDCNRRIAEENPSLGHLPDPEMEPGSLSIAGGVFTI